MRASKTTLVTVAALSAALFAGCLNESDASGETSILPSETSALVAFAGDSTRPAPARGHACDTLKARVAALDTTFPAYPGLKQAVDQVCAAKPARPDSSRPRPDSLGAHPSKPAKPDSLRPQPPKPDSLRPIPVLPDSQAHHPKPAPKPDSTKVSPNPQPKPAPKPPKDSVAAA